MPTGEDTTFGNDGGNSLGIFSEVAGGSVDAAFLSVNVIVGSDGSFIFTTLVLY